MCRACVKCAVSRHGSTVGADHVSPACDALSHGPWPFPAQSCAQEPHRVLAQPLCGGTRGCLRALLRAGCSPRRAQDALGAHAGPGRGVPSRAGCGRPARSCVCLRAFGPVRRLGGVSNSRSAGRVLSRACVGAERPERAIFRPTGLACCHQPSEARSWASRVPCFGPQGLFALPTRVPGNAR